MMKRKKGVNKGDIEDRRTGDDRLSRVLRQSIIGAKGFNGRVRNGIGWDTFAIITGSSILYIKKLTSQMSSLGLSRGSNPHI